MSLVDILVENFKFFKNISKYLRIDRAHQLMLSLQKKRRRRRLFIASTEKVSHIVQTPLVKKCFTSLSLI